MAKKGRKGQKKQQGPKFKVAKANKTKLKAKARKSGSKAVSTNLKKMSFDNNKKIDVLNADVSKVLLAPPKLNFLSPGATAPRPMQTKSAKKRNARKGKDDEDLDMVDVSSVAEKLASL